MKTLFNVSLLCSALALSSIANAIEIPTNVMTDYQAGLRGDGSANANAVQQLTQLHQQDGKDLVVLALLGSSETTSARYADQPWQKMKLAERGMGKLDKVLRFLTSKQDASPVETLRVNTTAGCTFVSVPAMFNRFEQGYQLLTQTIAAPMFSHVPPRAKISTYLCAAKAAAKAKDKTNAIQYIASLNQLAPHASFIASLNALKAQLEE